MPQRYFSKLLRAVVEFELIEEGDRILVGLSGGKDSLFLAYALALLRERMHKEFFLGALTIDPMFSPDFDMGRIREFCAGLGIPHEAQAVDIAGAIAQSGKNACFTCAYFRRGAMNRFAKAHGYGKIAYAHHHDDAVETFFMGLLYSGQLQTFAPKTYLDRTGLTVIRPLVYFREKELRQAVKFHGCAPVKSPCPMDGHTVRQAVKERIAEMGKEIPDLYCHLASAMRQSALGELWPAAKTRKEMQRAYHTYLTDKRDVE